MSIHSQPLQSRFGLCHFTLVEVEPPNLVSIAAEAGFGFVSLLLLLPSSYGPGFPMIGDTAMRRATRQRLDDTGVVLLDASTCRIEPGQDVADFLPMIESAAYLGALQVNVNGNDPDEGRLTERFAELCKMSADHGIRVGLEFMMSTTVRTLDDAEELIERSGATNASITVDSLHLARSGGDAADVARLDPRSIAYVQLCDAPSSPAAEGFAWEAARGRLLPGEGALPLRSLVDVLDPEALIAVEAPSHRRLEAGTSDKDFARAAIRSLAALTDRA